MDFGILEIPGIKSLQIWRDNHILQLQINYGDPLTASLSLRQTEAESLLMETCWLVSLIFPCSLSFLVIWTFYSLCLGCSPLAIPCPTFFKVKIPAQRWGVSLDLTASQGLSQNHLTLVSVCTIGWPLGTVERFPQLLGGLSSTFSSGIALSRREPPCKRSHPLSQLQRGPKVQSSLCVWLRSLLWKRPTSPSAYSCFLPLPTDVDPESTPQYIPSTSMSISEDLTSAHASPKPG